MVGKIVSATKEKDAFSKLTEFGLVHGEKRTMEGELDCPNKCKQTIIVPEPKTVMPAVLYDAEGKQVI